MFKASCNEQSSFANKLILVSSKARLSFSPVERYHEFTGPLVIQAKHFGSFFVHKNRTLSVLHKLFIRTWCRLN